MELTASVWIGWHKKSIDAKMAGHSRFKGGRLLIDLNVDLTIR